MDELADSAPLLHDQAGLRQRLAADGYLFFRALLPACQVQAAGDAVLAQLRSGDWIDDRGIPSVQPRAVNSMDALADPAFRAAIVGPAFNQVPYQPALREVIRRILGARAFSYPAKVLRAVYPERPQARPRGRRARFRDCSFLVFRLSARHLQNAAPYWHLATWLAFLFTIRPQEPGYNSATTVPMSPAQGSESAAVFRDQLPGGPLGGGLAGGPFGHQGAG